MAASTFRLELPQDLELRDSLTMRPLESMHRLMSRIEEYKRWEDDKAKARPLPLCSMQRIHGQGSFSQDRGKS